MKLNILGYSPSPLNPPPIEGGGDQGKKTGIQWGAGRIRTPLTPETRLAGNGGAYVEGCYNVVSGSPTLTFYRDLTGTAFTTSGTKLLNGFISVPI